MKEDSGFTVLSTETMYCRDALLTNQPTKGRSSQVNQYASMKSSRLYLTALGLEGDHKGAFGDRLCGPWFSRL